jgi:hypothetical protein
MTEPKRPERHPQFGHFLAALPFAAIVSGSVTHV